MENKNFFFNINSELKGIFENAIKEKIFPGAVVGITKFYGSKRELFLNTFGGIDYKNNRLEKNIFYDLASLTKPLATTLAILSLIKSKILNLEDTLPDMLGCDVPDNKKNIKLKNLLAHCSGLPAYKPYFKDENNNNLIKKILEENLLPKRQLYSDLGFMLIGAIIEQKTSLRLNDYVADKIYEPLGLNDLLFFSLNNKFKKNVNYAPTELCKWRKKLICGQVHDDNAYVMNGVAGHAGLFGNIYGVSGLVNSLIDIIEGRIIHPNIDREDLKKFITRQDNNESFAYDRGCTAGLGFDTPSFKNSSSGNYFSKNSFGHLGFTGTSFWVDLDKGISIILLSNRVYPDRENNKIRGFRPLFHNTIMGNI